jgi:hypothetical protein
MLLPGCPYADPTMTGQSAEFAPLTADDLVTGEAVALDLPAASV